MFGNGLGRDKQTRLETEEVARHLYTAKNKVKCQRSSVQHFEDTLEKKKKKKKNTLSPILSVLLDKAFLNAVAAGKKLGALSEC